jgi:hypothetical protein
MAKKDDNIIIYLGLGVLAFLWLRSQGSSASAIVQSAPVSYPLVTSSPVVQQAPPAPTSSPVDPMSYLPVPTDQMPILISKTPVPITGPTGILTLGPTITAVPPAPVPIVYSPPQGVAPGRILYDPYGRPIATTEEQPFMPIDPTQRITEFN